MSHRIHTRHPFASVAALIALLLGAALAMIGAPAYAHDELIGSSPAAGSEVAQLPDEITLTFSGVLLDEAGTTQVVVTDASGTDLTDGDPTLDGTKLTQPLAAGTAASGIVTVTWRVVSSDGHPVSDQFTFTVAGGADTTPTESSPAEASPAATATPAPTGTAPAPTGTAPPADDEGGSPAVWIGAGVAILAALVAVFAATAAAKRRRSED